MRLPDSGPRRLVLPGAVLVVMAVIGVFVPGGQPGPTAPALLSVDHRPHVAAAVTRSLVATHAIMPSRGRPPEAPVEPAGAANDMALAITHAAKAKEVTPEVATQLRYLLEPFLSGPARRPTDQVLGQFKLLERAFFTDVEHGAITGSGTVASIAVALAGLAVALGTTVMTFGAIPPALNASAP